MRFFIFSDYRKNTSSIFKSLKVLKLQDNIQFSIDPIIRGGSRTAATSKMQIFLIIKLDLGCCSSPRSASDNIQYFINQLPVQVKSILIKNESANPYNTRGGKLLFIHHINTTHFDT